MPKCWVQSGEEVGGTVSLWCKSSEGSTPLIYKWIKENGEALPSTAFQSKSSLCQGLFLLFQAENQVTSPFLIARLFGFFKINILSRLIRLDFEFDKMFVSFFFF